MWSDTFLLAERAHLLRVLAWAALSIVTGTAVITGLTVRRARASSPLLMHFAIQTAAWGAITLALAGVGLARLAERDLESVARLASFLWLNVGLDIGYIGAGATLAIAGWLLAKRLGAVGAGIGVAVQGVAYAMLDLYFLTIIARATHG